MTCPVCGLWAPDDPETGYDAGDICPSCQEAGWVETASGEILNERDDEEFAANGQDVRR